MGQIETQNMPPRSKFKLEKVGITNLKTLLVINRNGKMFRLIPTIKVTINLPSQIKGAHMSRIVESIQDTLHSELHPHKSVEEMALDTLYRLEEKHDYDQAEIALKFDFAVPQKTPVSKKMTIEVYEVEVRTERIRMAGTGFHFSHQISVTSKGNTVCPHSLANNNGKTHIQRAIGNLTVKGSHSEMPEFETLIDLIEGSFSSRTYSLLKTVDENHVVNQMFTHPYFVEDVCRNILNSAHSKFQGNYELEISAKVVSEESIHKHDVIACGQTTTTQE
ncbi:MAG: GTP cyclohydrolase, FolE2/MptA family [Candidatus Hodarchaeota archaeon]